MKEETKNTIVGGVGGFTIGIGCCLLANNFWQGIVAAILISISMFCMKKWNI